ncbi:hypothetical protein BJAS_P2748 [Bathymodiolus japonicus methanotrophic gill symbiont]|nr:hypothetical protein BJAS_P2748 [Bathymodiolus japonicus methanotrophic gill symbiont]
MLITATRFSPNSLSLFKESYSYTPKNCSTNPANTDHFTKSVSCYSSNLFFSCTSQIMILSLFGVFDRFNLVKEQTLNPQHLLTFAQARHAPSRNSGTPVAIIRSPTQWMGDALNALRPRRLSGTKNHHFAKLRFHDFQRLLPD